MSIEAFDYEGNKFNQEIFKEPEMIKLTKVNISNKTYYDTFFYITRATLYIFI